MDTLRYLSFFVGILFFAIANFKHRSVAAPAIGAGPFVLPWRTRDRYTPIGYRLQMAGLIFWGVSAVLAVIRLA